MDVKTGKMENVKTARTRDTSINMRVTREEKEEIERCAAILGMNQTELILNGVHIIDGMIRKHKEKQAEAGKGQGT